jgi:hypothetical protein
LFYASLLFGLAFISHVILWRIHLPKRQAKVVLFIFSGFLCCGSLLFLKYGAELSVFGLHPPSDLVGFLPFWLYYISLTLAYMITYSAVEVDSPSLIVITRIAEAGRPGLTQEGLDHLMDDEILVEPRLKDLLTDKMAVIHEGKYRLSKKGMMIAQLFRLYRTVLRANKGG